MDKAIGKEGFKIILLLRLSPIFPFALSNYFYGVTAVNFVDYITGTMLGFLPGTLAYVYGGTVRRFIAIFAGRAPQQSERGVEIICREFLPSRVIPPLLFSSFFFGVNCGGKETVFLRMLRRV